MRLQAVDRSGARVTFHPHEVKDGKVYGTSSILGACHVELEHIERLFFGDAIAADVEKLAHHRLKLHAATQPRFLSAGDDAPRSAGQESALVGKAAPPVRLNLLDGTSFRLSDQRGRIVVMDFWATWCGPCIQWLPQLEEIVGEFPEEQVLLVTVNLAEDEESITAVLNRLEIDPLVAMDIDGVVAAAYQATAIPQTVIVDQHSVIDRLLIGGGSQAKAPLRAALERLTAESD